MRQGRLTGIKTYSIPLWGTGLVAWLSLWQRKISLVYFQQDMLALYHIFHSMFLLVQDVHTFWFGFF